MEATLISPALPPLESGASCSFPRTGSAMGLSRICPSKKTSPSAPCTGCFFRSPSLLLLDEPARGVDVGAKAEIYQILRRLASQGIGVLFTSSEFEETRVLADRVLVLCQGRISRELL